MCYDDINPGEIEFWKARLADGSIFDALRVYPDRAKRFFGSTPVMNKNLLQLVMILGARETLATPLGHVIIDRDDALEKEVRIAMNTLSNEQRLLVEEFFDKKNQEKFLRTSAEEIIRDATGCEP